MGADLAAARAGRHARLPGQRAGWWQGEVAGAGRQQPSDLDPDRRFRDRRRPHQYRGDRAGQYWERFCRTAGLDHLLAHPDYKTGKLRSVRNTATPRGDQVGAASEVTSAAWIDAANKAGAAVPINTIDKVFADPQIQHLGIAQVVESGGARETRIWSVSP